jgi:hypothetical protein
MAQDERSEATGCVFVCVGMPELMSDPGPSDLHRHSLYYQHICKLFNPIDCHSNYFHLLLFDWHNSVVGDFRAF